MAEMHRREYKRTVTAVALEEASQIVNIDDEDEEWDNYLPACMDKVNSHRPVVRVAGLLSLVELFSREYRGNSPSISSIMNEVMSAISDSITSPQRRDEYESALIVVCLLALNSFSRFESFSPVFINDVLPTLPEITREHSLAFFALAFIVSFGVKSKVTCLQVFDQYVELMLNKKSRSVEFTTDVIVEIARGLKLMLSVFPSSVAAVTHREVIERVIDQLLSSTNPNVLVAGVNLIPVVYESIVQELEDPAEHSLFVGKYQGKVKDLPLQVTKKADQKTVRNASSIVEGYLDGELLEDKLTLNSQIVPIEGPRHLTFVEAIRRVTKTHFQEQMCTNVNVHTSLGFELMSNHVALRMKKKFKKEVTQERGESKRDREQDIAKKRRQKDQRTFAGDDDRGF